MMFWASSWAGEWASRDALGPDRLLYGSDIPVRENAITIGRILGSRLSAAERHKVFFANTARLLNLKLN